MALSIILFVAVLVMIKLYMVSKAADKAQDYFGKLIDNNKYDEFDELFYKCMPSTRFAKYCFHPTKWTYAQIFPELVGKDE